MVSGFKVGENELPARRYFDAHAGAARTMVRFHNDGPREGIECGQGGDDVPAANIMESRYGQSILLEDGGGETLVTAHQVRSQAFEGKIRVRDKQTISDVAYREHAGAKISDLQADISGG